MHQIVQDYYGRTLQQSSDLKTTACCDASAVPAWLKPWLARIHPEVLSRYYGLFAGGGGALPFDTPSGTAVASGGCR